MWQTTSRGAYKLYGWDKVSDRNSAIDGRERQFV